jgi:hypothetical protein
MILAIPGLILAMIAQAMTKSTFSKYAKYGASSGLTGAQAAQRMLQSQGIMNVDIEPVRGFLSDHFDPRTNTLRLSPDVYNSQSLSAIGVACHEAGHALQKATHYAPLGLRTALVPAAQFGSSFAYIIFIAGFFLRMSMLVNLGLLLFTAAVAFTLITLPVEWNASSRAKKLMVSAGIVSPQEKQHAGTVLNAAFMTYIASAVSALLTLLYFLLRAGVLGGDD